MSKENEDFEGRLVDIRREIWEEEYAMRQWKWKRIAKKFNMPIRVIFT